MPIRRWVLSQVRKPAPISPSGVISRSRPVKPGSTCRSKSSEGSIDNIKRINSTESTGLGIVQSDVMGFLIRSKNPESLRMAANLRVVFPLYNEEVHVLARRDIHSLAELQGKKVAIGEEGSGNMLTALNLFSLMSITPADMKKIPSAQGVVAVLKGELDAVVFVGGKPVRLFKNLEDLAMPENQRYNTMLDQVHFLPLNDPKILAEYKPAMLTRAGLHLYRGRCTDGLPCSPCWCPYDFSQRKGSKRCDMLSLLAKTIRDSLPVLQQSGHPEMERGQSEC